MTLEIQGLACDSVFKLFIYCFGVYNPAIFQFNNTLLPLLQVKKRYVLVIFIIYKWHLFISQLLPIFLED